MSEAEPRIETLCDIACELGEGPAWDPYAGALFWLDIVARRMLEQKPGAETVIHELPFMASAVAAIDAERQLVVSETGLHVRSRADGALSLLASVEADRADTRSNDARVHPSGALWFGTMGKEAQRKAGAIYRHFRGETRTLFPEITIPNSICFSPDGATAYYADTAKNLLFRVECDPSNGLPTGEPKLFLDHRGHEGGLDGSVIDRDGVIWNARWGAGRIDAYAPDGEHLRSIAMPVRQPSCPAFQGPAADRLAVTSAWQGMDEEARAADPHAGKTFLVDLPVRGRHEPLFALAG